ncbi:MAG: uroporphyrinogen-III synthase [Pseudomonadales bacterium]|nr:uroporphyrinogen-III synthase [Pseudomonadales bacterium]
MATTSLTTLNVLITRPIEQQQILKDAISSRGGGVTQMPLIEIKPLQRTASKPALESKIQHLDSYHILIFVSSNAVQYAATWINDYWPRFPAGVAVIAIGPTTAQALSARFGCEVVHSPAGMTSEDLLELPELKRVEGKRIGIFRGQGGRDLLADTLRSRGGEIDYLEVYRRLSVHYDAKEFCASLRTEAVNVLTITSAESLFKLDSLVRDNKEEWGLIPLLVPSARLAQQAEQSGFGHVINTEGADTMSFVAALELLADKIR